MSRNPIIRCPACKRNKNKAMQEQKLKGEPCYIDGCMFENEINEMLLRKVIINVIKKEKNEKIVVKKIKPNIIIIRK